MKMTRSPLFTAKRALPILLAASVPLAACGSDSTDNGSEAGPDAGSTPETTPETEVSEELQAIIDAANEEGSLELAGRATLYEPELLIEGFEQYYPGLDIEVRDTPGASQGETASRVREEAQAGQPAHTDVLNITGGAIPSLVADDALLEDVEWEALPDVLPEMVDTVYGAGVEIQRFLHVVAYNTDAVRPEDLPQTTQDLLKPEFKGRIGTTPFVGGFEVLMIERGFEETRDYIEQFTQQLGGQTGRGSDVQPLITGQFDMVVFLIGTGKLLEHQKKGAPIDFTILNDAAITYQNMYAIPSNAPHPNAAKLWINYVASSEGQTILRENGFLDSPLLPGSLTGQQIEEAEAAGAEFINADVAWYEALDQEEYNKNFTELVTIVRSGIS